MDEKLDFYRNIIEEKYGSHIDNETKKQYLDYALNYIKEKIIYCYNNKQPINGIKNISKEELLKNGMMIIKFFKLLKNNHRVLLRDYIL